MRWHMSSCSEVYVEEQKFVVYSFIKTIIPFVHVIHNIYFVDICSYVDKAKRQFDCIVNVMIIQGLICQNGDFSLNTGSDMSAGFTQVGIDINMYGSPLGSGRELKYTGTVSSPLGSGMELIYTQFWEGIDIYLYLLR